MADIFISYARKDKTFVRRLHEALAAKKLDTWADWEDIPPAADFMQEIFAAIEAADTVAVILSPDWCSSPVCRKELDHAIAHNKRLVPLVWRDVDPAQVPGGIAALNWIFFRETDEFDAAIESLISAIHTDLERVRAMTRLLVRAIEWNGKSRETSFLLRGLDLGDGERLVMATAVDEQPQPTPLQREYVLASRLDAVRRQRRTLAFVSGGLVVAVALAVLAFWQYRVAEERRQGEQAARLDAERQTRVANAQRLAAQADEALDRFPQRSLLLAVEAANVTLRRGEPLVADANQSLRRALAAVGGRGFGGAGLPITRIALSPDSHWLAMGSVDAVYLWDLTDKLAAAPSLLPGMQGTATDVTFGRDSRWLVAVTRDHGPVLWNLAGGHPVTVPFQLPAGVDAVLAVISADRRTLIGGTRSGVTVVWNLASQTPAADPRTFAKGDFVEFEFFPIGGAAVVTSANGRWMAAKQVGVPARLWDLETNRAAPVAVELAGSDGLVPYLAISPNQRWLLSAGHDFAIRVWDLAAANPAAHPLVLRGHTDEPSAVAFSDDSRWLVTGSLDRTARVWDLGASRPEASVRVLRGHGDMVRAASISADGRWAVSSSLVNGLDVNGPSDTTARLWDLRRPDAEAKPYELTGHEAGVTAAMLTADGHRVLTASNGGRLRIWDVTAENPSVKPLVLRGSERGIDRIAQSADGRWAVALGTDSSVRVWDLRAPQPSGTPLQFQPGTPLDFSPDGDWLVTTDRNTGYVSDLRLDDPAATSFVVPKLASFSTRPSVAFSRDSRWLALGNEFEAARLLDLASPGSPARSLDDGGGEIYTLSISADGRWLTTNRKYHSSEIRLWNLKTPNTSPDHLVITGVTKCTSRPDSTAGSTWIVTGGEDTTLRFWNLASDDPRVDPIVLSGLTQRVTACAFSPDGRTFVAATDDGAVQMWTVEGGRLSAAPVRLPGQATKRDGVQFSPDGRWLTTTLYADPMRLWDMKTPSASPARVFPAHDGDVRSIDFSRDGHWMVTVDENNAARIWNLRLDDPTATFFTVTGHADGVGLVAISPDSRWVATAGASRATFLNDRTVRLWDLSKPNPTTSPLLLLGHERGVRSLAMSGDSRWLVSGSEDGTARLWDLGAADPSATAVVLSGGGAGVAALLVSPDSRYLATSDGVGAVRLWHLRQDDLLTSARAVAGRNLSLEEWALFFPGQPYRQTFPEFSAAREPPH